MCGIIGFAGNTEAVSVLLDGLKRLEYRGYDSAGVAVVILINRGIWQNLLQWNKKKKNCASEENKVYFR